MSSYLCYCVACFNYQYHKELAARLWHLNTFGKTHQCFFCSKLEILSITYSESAFIVCFEFPGSRVFLEAVEGSPRASHCPLCTLFDHFSNDDICEEIFGSVELLHDVD